MSEKPRAGQVSDYIGGGGGQGTCGSWNAYCSPYARTTSELWERQANLTIASLFIPGLGIPSLGARAAGFTPNITFQSIRATGAQSLVVLSPSVTARAVTSVMVGYSSRLFGSANLGARSGLLNRADAHVRIGWSTLNRTVTGTTTHSVFRVAVGQQKFNVFRGPSLYAQ